MHVLETRVHYVYDVTRILNASVLNAVYIPINLARLRYQMRDIYTRRIQKIEREGSPVKHVANFCPRGFDFSRLFPSPKLLLVVKCEKKEAQF